MISSILSSNRSAVHTRGYGVWADENIDPIAIGRQKAAITVSEGRVGALEAVSPAVF
jgi:hypothetical protein